MAPGKLLGILLLLLIFLKNVHGSKSKKTIKIHVPYYVKHIHHYKKVYVPKVQVVKHEHLHKKEHEHHHHHDHHGHYHHGYDKSSDGGYHDDSYESYYDDIDHRSYSTNNNNNQLSRAKPRLPFHGRQADNFRGHSSEEVTSDEEEDYDVSGQEDEGTVPAPLPFRPRPTSSISGITFRKPQRVRGWAEKNDVHPTSLIGVVTTPVARLPGKRVIARITT